MFAMKKHHSIIMLSSTFESMDEGTNPHKIFCPDLKSYDWADFLLSIYDNNVIDL